MRYLPFALLAGGVPVVVGYALYLTHDPRCLWGLLVAVPISYYANATVRSEPKSKAE